MTRFQVEADGAALEWLAAHKPEAPRVIAYEVHRCCGGGRICRASVRELSQGDRRENYATGSVEGGAEILIDRRAASRLPPRFGLAVSGVGPFKHLDLVLDGEQWGELLYS